MCYQRNQISRIHHGTLNTESPEPYFRLSPKTYAKNTLFQWGPPLYDLGRKLIFLMGVEGYFGTGEAIQQICYLFLFPCCSFSIPFYFSFFQGLILSRVNHVQKRICSLFLYFFQLLFQRHAWCSCLHIRLLKFVKYIISSLYP